ncbi:MAG: hypothetical protein R6U39_10440 [Candidatus Aegiribacteria sp.]
MKAVLFGIVLTFAVSGCHEVTEFQSGERSGITLVRTSDLQAVSTLEGIDGGRSIISVSPSELVVFSSGGLLYRIDTAEMRVDTSYKVGGSSGMGYGEAVQALNGHLYVLGPGSQVLEIDLEADAVVDMFQPGPSPSALAASPTEPRLYFVDSAENFIGEIYLVSNVVGFTSSAGLPLADIIVEPLGGRHIIAPCSNSRGYVYGVWLDLSTAARLLGGIHNTLQTGSPAGMALPLPSDSVYAVCSPEWNSSGGVLHMIQGYVEFSQPTHTAVQGHPVDMCFTESTGLSGNLFVLSRTDEGGSVISMYEFPSDYRHPELAATLTLEGMPRGIVRHAGEEYIAVLTSY